MFLRHALPTALALATLMSAGAVVAQTSGATPPAGTTSSPNAMPDQGDQRPGANRNTSDQAIGGQGAAEAGSGIDGSKGSVGGESDAKCTAPGAAGCPKP